MSWIDVVYSSICWRLPRAAERRMGSDITTEVPAAIAGDLAIDRNAATAAGPDVLSADALIDDELLVEEISIDGMCGVY